MEKVIRRLVAQLLPPFLIVSTSAAVVAAAEALSTLFVIAATVVVVGLQLVAQFVSTKVQETVALFGPFTTVSVRLVCRFTVNKVYGFYAIHASGGVWEKRNKKKEAI
jgi:hypothetical protein